MTQNWFFHQILFRQLNGKWSKVRQCGIWLVHKEGGPAQFFYILHIIYKYVLQIIFYRFSYILCVIWNVRMMMIISTIIVITCGAEPQGGVEASWVDLFVHAERNQRGTWDYMLILMMMMRIIWRLFDVCCL